MSISEIEKYCGISELQVRDLSKVKNCKNFKSEDAKKYNFLVIDVLARKGLLKENPANKKSL